MKPQEKGISFSAHAKVDIVPYAELPWKIKTSVLRSSDYKEQKDMKQTNNFDDQYVYMHS